MLEFFFADQEFLKKYPFAGEITTRLQVEETKLRLIQPSLVQLTWTELDKKSGGANYNGQIGCQLSISSLHNLFVTVTTLSNFTKYIKTFS